MAMNNISGDSGPNQCSHPWGAGANANIESSPTRYLAGIATKVSASRNTPVTYANVLYSANDTRLLSTATFTHFRNASASRRLRTPLLETKRRGRPRVPGVPVADASHTCSGQDRARTGLLQRPSDVVVQARGSIRRAKNASSNRIGRKNKPEST